METAAARWKAELESWAIPEEILARAPEPPWGFPVELFRTGDEPAPDTPSRRRALEALPPGGTVLDVGCGGGRASLALAGCGDRSPSLVVGVDESPELLALFAESAGSRGLAHDEVLGSWPAVAPAVGPADLVLCHHVLYNVPDPVPFLQALSAHARRRVVMELTDRHPMVAQAPLWLRFHGLERPTGPSAEEALEVLAEAGIEAHSEHYVLRLPEHPREPMVAFTRRRLCLPASRDREIDEALGEWRGERDITTIWWDTA
jgi:SAM-dependent methyltransferase